MQVTKLKEESPKSLAERFPADLSEAEMRNTMHGMSHQKVKAEKKWLFELMTEKKTERLITVIEANDYDHEKTYLAMLKRWKNNDFSQAVEDHNTLWKLDGGTVGKATDLLSIEEEKAFISEHYDIVE